MKDFIRYQRTLFGIILLLGAGAFGGLYLGWPEEPSLAWGWALGVAVGGVIFRNRVLAVLRLPTLPEEQWVRASLRASFFSYGLIVAAVVAAIYLSAFNPYATLAGILLERLVLYADGWLRPGALSEAGEAPMGRAAGGEKP
ncbi:MAG: hypothetical protein V1918_03735 [Planctomycetota bacterium]